MIHAFRNQGNRPGKESARSGYQSMRRDDGARLECSAAPSLWIRKVLAIALVIVALALIANGDLILQMMGEN